MYAKAGYTNVTSITTVCTVDAHEICFGHKSECNTQVSESLICKVAPQGGVGVIRCAGKGGDVR